MINQPVPAADALRLEHARGRIGDQAHHVVQHRGLQVPPLPTLPPPPSPAPAPARPAAAVLSSPARLPRHPLLTDPATWAMLTCACVAVGSGMDVSKWSAMTQSMLSKMPGGRCPYPPGTEPGPGPGFNTLGHYVG